MTTDDARHLLESIAQVGREHPSRPPLHEVEIFEPYFDSAGRVIQPDKRDGSCTRRELLLRYLLLNAVLDQGPDTEGVRLLLTRVTNDLYRREVRFLHRPEVFFENLGVAIDRITSVHEVVKNLRSQQWAQDNVTKAARYSLFMDGAHQALSYAVFRWGTPLAVPLLLTRDESDEAHRAEALHRYLVSWPSAEIASRQLKEHHRYGLGKAVGYKATHLYVKWVVHTFRLVEDDNPGWGPFGFEVPFDSNAGRVLFRTGFLLHWATMDDYKDWGVVNEEKGKGGTDYIRVTNIRSKKSALATSDPHLLDLYRRLCREQLQVAKGTPRKVEIQRIPSLLLLDGGRYTPGELDDGLMYIGTHFCFNHAAPLCPACPVEHLCRGRRERDLIEGYRT